MTLRSIVDVAAPAKLNLFLHVVGRRADGYHLLESLFVLVDWCDTLHFERRNDGSLARHDLGDALPDDDLCLRAARWLQRESGTSLGADISIVKRVPSGAGMGGGSSDAASTLLALNRLWQLNWTRDRLQALGLKLGADVPFFVGGHNALVQGIGERLTPVTVAAEWLAVIKPAASIATAALFGSPLLVRDRVPAAILESFAESAEIVQPGFGTNDLQAAAEAECAQVVQAASALHQRFGNSRMTGSGSAVFARAGTGHQPSAAMPDELAPGWTGRMCRSLNEHPLVGWSADC